MKKILRKTILILGMLLVVALPMASEAKTFAAGPDQISERCNGSFLGLKPWYADLGSVLDPTNCTISGVTDENLSKVVWTVVANIATDITIIAAYAALIYVIYGGYLYMFSEGDPSKAMASRRVLRTAFIGLAITMSANLIFGTIKAILAGGTTGTALVTLQNGETVTVPNANAGLLFTDIISWFIGMGGVIAAIFVVFGGISYITANGDAGKIVKAKNMILYALIGLAIVGLAELITSAVAGMIRDANNQAESTSYSNSIMLAKEANEK